MSNSGSLVRAGWWAALALALTAGLLSGCASKLQQALDQAKAQAAKTGQPQQVVSVDKHGITTTTFVQPPLTGQKTEVMTTTVEPPPAGAPLPKPMAPTVSPLKLPPPPQVSMNIPAGTRLTIRVDQRISVKHSYPGEMFTGEEVVPVTGSDGSVLVPKNTPVAGVVDVAHRRGHFKGRSLLELRLTSLALDGTRYRIATQDLVESKRGKGRRSTALIGGGSGLGMLVGGVATGGVGLAVGGLVGGGLGTATAGLTGNRDIVIPAESIVHFTLERDLVVQQPPGSANKSMSMAEPNGNQRRPITAD